MTFSGSFSGAFKQVNLNQLYSSAVKPEDRNFVRPGQKLPIRLDGAVYRRIKLTAVSVTSSFNDANNPIVMQSYMPGSGKLCMILNTGSSTHNVAYSNDHGATWASTTLPNSTLWHRIVNDGTYFYALREVIGVGGELYRSSTGSSWTLMSNITMSAGGTARNLINLIYANGSLYFWQGDTGTNGTLARSTDGGNSWSYSTATTEVNPSTAFAVNSSGLMALYSSTYALNTQRIYTATNINGPWTAVSYPYSPTPPTFLYYSDTPIACLNDVFVLGDPGVTQTKDFITYTSGEYHPTVSSIESQFSNNAKPLQITSSSTFYAYGGYYTAAGIKMSSDSFIPLQDYTPSSGSYDNLTFGYPSATPVVLSETTYGFGSYGAFITAKIDNDSSFAPDIGLISMASKGYGGLGTGYQNRFYYRLNDSSANYAGHLLDYKASEKYKHCDGVSTYPSSSAHLKRYMPNVTKTAKPFGATILPLTNALYAIASMAYVNSTLVAMVVPQVGDPVLASSTNNGSTWTVESTWPFGTYGGLPGTQNFVGYDGSKYYVPTNNGIYTASALSGTWSISGWIPATYPDEYPIAIKSVSTSNTYLITAQGSPGSSSARVFQTTNQGASWTLIATISSFYPYGFIEQGGTYYVYGNSLSGGRIWSSTNMTSWSVISSANLDIDYYIDLKYNSTTSTWAAASGFNGGVHVSTDGMATWTRINGRSYVNDVSWVGAWRLIGNVGEYWIDIAGNVGIDPTDPTCFKGWSTPITNPSSVPMSKVTTFTIAGSGEAIFANIGVYENNMLFMTPWSVTIDPTVVKVASNIGQSNTYNTFPAYMLIE